MTDEPFRIVTPDRYEIATEVLSSAIRILVTVGFSEDEIPGLLSKLQIGARASRYGLCPHRADRKMG